MCHTGIACMVCVTLILFCIIIKTQCMVYRGSLVSTTVDQSAQIAFFGIDTVVNLYGKVLFMGDQYLEEIYSGTMEILKWNQANRCYSIAHATYYADCPIISSTVFRGCRDAVVYTRPHSRIHPQYRNGLLLTIIEPRMEDSGIYYIRTSIDGFNKSDYARTSIFVCNGSSGSCSNPRQKVSDEMCIPHVNRIAFERYLTLHVGRLPYGDLTLQQIRKDMTTTAPTYRTIRRTTVNEGLLTAKTSPDIDLNATNLPLPISNYTDYMSVIWRRVALRRIYAYLVIAIIALLIVTVCSAHKRGSCSRRRRIYIGNEPTTLTSITNGNFQEKETKNVPSDISDAELLERLEKKIEMLRTE
ncbi:US7 membrane glycoprotein I [Meleagrid alphaherpesvirus 1]|uniref:Envelope glycoprotein I n=2 Tax=Mardivirus TaxID=180252 RepID=Q77L57_MEHV1|nr:envelope glycoprotein I [Meleagrid alphaherpesvirus 1]AKQ48617.1 envelope glycoprotein I [iBAC vector pMeHV1-C7]AKQ48689.1 envelope glycoprotein I [iBAC vector pMeHV1-C9]AKQ48761.1 envelope glycoprotein I [iBAC vector pMeHV1-C10]AKQ48833.1 envelope glycoprotein I [iBAC vector pMeHV1-C17]AKQ48906.1 envelope glycoprotein I [iBAC vector pMeHV1-C18]CAA48618.1 glycoprotein homologue I [Gallid alphaherpesvirus 2]